MTDEPASGTTIKSTAGSQTAQLLIAPIGELATPWIDSGPARGAQMGQIRRIKNAALAVADGRIIFVGSEQEARDKVKVDGRTTLIDARRKLVIPGLVDPHTHTVFGGNRANEFLMRCQGKTYREIAEAGGGIVASMRATGGATREQLVDLARPRVRRMLEHSATTVEIKTGYGLSLDSELNMLEAILDLSESEPVDIVPTFMPAHAVPPGMERESYVSEIIDQMIPRARAVIEGRGGKTAAAFVDVFCDKGYFTRQDTQRIFDAARKNGFSLKVHADEFENLGATTLAVEYGAASADHLLKISQREIELLGQSQTVAVLLPGTSFYLNLDAHAPARKMIEKNVAVALGSDFNPGSCHIFSLPIILGLACLHLRMTVEEALTALSLNAAFALGRGFDRGMLREGYRADITICDIETLEEIPYNLGWNPVECVIRSGNCVVSDKRSA